MEVTAQEKLISIEDLSWREGPLILLTYYIDLFDSETVDQLGQVGIKGLAHSVCNLVAYSTRRHTSMLAVSKWCR